MSSVVMPSRRHARQPRAIVRPSGSLQSIVGLAVRPSVVDTITPSQATFALYARQPGTVVRPSGSLRSIVGLAVRPFVVDTLTPSQATFTLCARQPGKQPIVRPSV